MRMASKVFAIAIALLFVSGFAVAAVSAEKDKSDKESNGTVMGKGHDNDDLEVDELNEKAKKLGLFGKLAINETNVTGKFVTFNIDLANGTIENYTLRGNNITADLVQSLIIDNISDLSPIVTGSVMKVGNESLGVKIHDNPTGMIQIFSNGSGTNISILFSKGINATEWTMNGDEFNDEYDYRSAVLLQGLGIRGFITIENGTIGIENTTAGLYVNATLGSIDGMKIRFTPMVGERNGVLERSILMAIMEGRINAEISLVGSDEGAMYDEMVYDDNTDFEVTSGENGAYHFEVRSNNGNAKVFLINIDSESIGHANGLKVQVSGEEAEHVDDVDEVLYAGEMGCEKAIYASVDSDGVSQILVFIPSFTSESVDIVSVSEADGVVAWGVAAAGAAAIVAVAGYILFRRM